MPARHQSGIDANSVSLSGFGRFGGDRAILIEEFAPHATGGDVKPGKPSANTVQRLFRRPRGYRFFLSPPAGQHRPSFVWYTLGTA